MTRIVAIAMLIVGGLGLLVSCQMNTSVPTGFGRVINLSLIAQQQNMSLVSAVFFMAGIILFATSKPTQSPSGRGVDEYIFSQHTTALDRRIISTTTSIINEFHGMSFKERLALFGIVLFMFSFFAISTNIYASFVIAPAISYLYVRYVNRLIKDTEARRTNDEFEGKTGRTTDRFAVAILAIFAVAVVLFLIIH